MNKSDELTAGGFLRKLVGFSMASWLSAAISFIVTPIYTRIYIPEEMGHINLFTTYMTFFQTICVMALDQAYMRFYNEEMDGIRKDNFLGYCLKFNMIIAAASSILIIGGYNYFSAAISDGQNIVVPICLAVVIVCSTFLRMSSISSRMEKNVLQYTIQVLAVTFTEKVVITLVGFYRPSHKLAIMAMTGAYVILSLIFAVIKKGNMHREVNVTRESRNALFKFAIPYMPVLLLSWLNSSIPLLVLKKYVSYGSIGIYTSAVTMANILTIVQTGFSAYWEPFFYEHYKSDGNKEKIRKIQQIAAFVLIFAAISIVLFQDIIYLLIGEKYRLGKLVFPCLMFTPICSCISDIVGIGVKLSKKNYLNVFAFAGSVVVNLALSYILVPHIGIVGAGIAVMTAALTMLTIRCYLGRKFYKISESCTTIILALILMILAAIVNIAADGLIIKYIAILILLILHMLIFRKEIIYMLKLVIKIVKK